MLLLWTAESAHVFRPSNPVSATDFFDREAELAKLTEHLARLEAGAPSWVAILGHRKVGKTSLLIELQRRTASAGIRFVILDTLEFSPLDADIIRSYALRVADSVLSRELGVSLESRARSPAAYRAALAASTQFSRFPEEVRAILLELPELRIDPQSARACLDLAQRLAEACDLRLVVAWDEFQALARIRGRWGEAIHPLLRSAWQQHDRVAYIISGSERGMLRELVTAEHAPFFQHFAIMELGVLPEEEGLRLLTQAAPPDRPIPEDVARGTIAVLGSHPFYLQLFGEELTRQPPPYGEAALKQCLQALLFSRTGRLSLFFENEHRAAVGRSTFLDAAVTALASGPLHLAELAKAIRVSSAAAAGYLKRLGDLVLREGDHYRLTDPVFATWVRWRAPGGTVIPAVLLGDEGERAAARWLAGVGFELVYQSLASRGAFDLLALRGRHQLGVQVRRRSLPLHFTAAEWNRMDAESRRLGWRWLLVAVDPATGAVVPLDPALAAGRTVGIEAKIDNLLVWVDRG